MVNQIKDTITYYTRHNFLLYRQMAKISALQNMDPAELKALEIKEAMKMIRFAAENSEFYKKLYAKFDLRESFEIVYPQLPVITKRDIRDNEHTIITDPVHILKKAHTSGTSGSPLNMYRSAGAIMKENAYLWQYRISQGLNLGDPFVSMRGVLDNKTLHYTLGDQYYAINVEDRFEFVAGKPDSTFVLSSSSVNMPRTRSVVMQNPPDRIVQHHFDRVSSITQCNSAAEIRTRLGVQGAI